MDMENKLSVFGIGIDSRPAKESLKAAIELMDGEGLSTIEILTMDMLLKERDNEEIKEILAKMDLVLPESEAMLKMAENPEVKHAAETAEKRGFLQMYLKYLQKYKKRVFLLAEDDRQCEQVSELLKKEYRGILLTGSGVLPEGGEEESVINEINGLEIDCILSVLSSPHQELFAENARNMLSAKMWLGLSRMLRKKQEEGKKTYKAKNFFIRNLFRHSVGKENRQDQQN